MPTGADFAVVGVQLCSTIAAIFVLGHFLIELNGSRSDLYLYLIFECQIFLVFGYVGVCKSSFLMKGIFFFLTGTILVPGNRICDTLTWFARARSIEDETRNGHQSFSISRYKVELIGFEFRGILRYKFNLRFLFNLNLQLTKISQSFRISICISFTISCI